jgi:hypothetical protein
MFLLVALTVVTRQTYTLEINIGHFHRIHPVLYKSAKMLRTKKDLRSGQQRKLAHAECRKVKSYHTSPGRLTHHTKWVHRDGRAELPSFLYKFLYTASDLPVAQ